MNAERWTERAACRTRRPLLELTAGELNSYLHRESSRTPGRMTGPDARYNELSGLRGFYRWAVREGLVLADPTDRLERPVRVRRVPRPIPHPDLARAIDRAPERIRPWLYLAAYAGLRACEVGPLRGEDIWWQYDPPLIFIAEQKGGDEAMVPMAPILEPIVRALPSRGWLFPRGGSQEGRWDGPTSAGQVSKLANAYLRSQGISHSFHTLRHWAGTEFHRLSGDLRLTQEFLRHRSISSTQIYTQVAPAAVARVVCSLPPLAAA